MLTALMTYLEVAAGFQEASEMPSGRTLSTTTEP
jgi:hypothetical protein